MNAQLQKQALKKARRKRNKAAKVKSLELKLAAFLNNPEDEKVVSHGTKKPRTTSQSSAYVSSDTFLFSYEWRRVRMVALKKYGPVCQCCGASPATGAVMNVDHIKPRRLFPQLALDVENLQILCGECNHGKGNWDMTDWRNSGDAPELDSDSLSHLRSISLE